jgi:chloramphenicol-sensitive protein RarD
MQSSETTKGLCAAALAFTIWGLLPIYWKALQAVSAVEILCHRIFWSMLFSAVLLLVSKRFYETKAAFSSWQRFLHLAVSSLLIGGNWLTYIWGVNAGYVVECSLGYYINPLVNVLFGFLVFRDRLRTIQWIAVAFAAAGVLNQILIVGKLPWIALVLAVSFSLYGVSRKLMQLGPVPGLFIETALLSPLSLFFIISWSVSGQGSLTTQGYPMMLLLIGCGVVTSIPLILFAYGARRLKLATVGLLQYIGPTGMLLLGVFLYDEPFSTPTLVTFCLIWTGVILYSMESLRFGRQSTFHKSRQNSCKQC